MPSPRLVPFLAFGWLIACGGKTSTTSETSDAARTPTDAAAEPAATCSWSSSFEPIDATPMRDSCRAARRLLTCKGSDGSGAMCVTDKMDCDLPPAPGVTYTCANECKSTEFGATCGTVTGASVVPPADCPIKMPTPAGIIFYCCTCST